MAGEAEKLALSRIPGDDGDCFTLLDASPLWAMVEDDIRRHAEQDRNVPGSIEAFGVHYGRTPFHIDRQPFYDAADALYPDGTQHA